MASSRLKVVVDKAACCGYGVCAEICPEMYKLDGNGIVYVDDPMIPPALEQRVREGAAACPQAALTVEAAD